ncbi:uncharacterized protein CTRU02_201964 [Colletotrichum truncatum]|uniref:Uncharacterized protein n=1 Tax=Colletotrichum truncatum TaxID=5467 RepID=A0ACC3ZJH5_COLTU
MIPLCAFFAVLESPHGHMYAAHLTESWLISTSITHVCPEYELGRDGIWSWN